MNKKNLLILVLIPGLIYSQNLLNGPNDIVYESRNNRYLVSNWAGNSIVEIDSLGNQSYYRNNIPNAHGMAIKRDTLYLAANQNLLLIDLNSNSIAEAIYIEESAYLGHIALDSSHNVYLTDWSSRKLFRINLIDKTSTTLHTFNSSPVGVSYELSNDRLILLTLVDDAPILAYSLTGNNIYTVTTTNINDPDAICRDSYGNYYVTSFSENVVYRFDNDFLSVPEIISTGHGGPSGIGYNKRDDIIGVTNYNFNSIDLIQLEPNGIVSPPNSSVRRHILFQNYPNPFNPSTKIKFIIPSNVKREMSKVTLIVYDVLGDEVATLVNEEKPAGEYEVEFSRNLINQVPASGIYFFQLRTTPIGGQAGEFIETKKMLLLK